MEDKLDIGGYLIDDIKHFCDISEFDDFFKRIRGIENGYNVFHWPIVFLGSIWFAYKGMLKEAVLIDIGKWILQYLVMIFCSKRYLLDYQLWIMLAIVCLYHMIFAFCGIKMYWKYIKKCLDRRNLKGRLPEECPKLQESLLKEGKPSVKRAALYVFFVTFLTKTCLNGVLTTLYWTIAENAETVRRILSFTLE